MFWLGVVSIAVFVGGSDDIVIVREISSFGYLRLVAVSE